MASNDGSSMMEAMEPMLSVNFLKSGVVFDGQGPGYVSHGETGGSSCKRKGKYFLVLGKKL
jgi:hypothetical protein